MKIVTARPHRLLPCAVREIGRLSGAGEPCMLLVPSQYTLQAELELLFGLGTDGWFLIDVLSPARLQSRVFERAGAPSRTIFDERGKRMVLSDIAMREKETLTLYRAAAENALPGFVARLSALIADLKRGGQTPEDVLSRAGALPETSAAREKLLDAAKLYAAYERRMAGELADAEDVSLEMRARLARSGVVTGRHVFVLGFDMLTPSFAAELIAIAGLCASLTLLVEADDASAPDGHLFTPVNFSIERLCALAAERGVPVRRERLDAPLDAPEDIRLLESHLFALGESQCAREPEHISLRAASGPRREVHLAAADIRELLASGLRSEDIAVVYPRGGVYAALLTSILPEYGAAAYVAEKRPASAHPLCRFLMGALAAASGGFRVSDVAECAQSGFLGLSRAETDEFLSYMEDYGVRPGQMLSPFAYRKDDDAEALSRLNAIRERAVAPLKEFSDALSHAGERDGESAADAAVSAVLALLGRVGAFDRLEEMREELIEAGFASEAEDCAQVWNALMDTLDQLHTLLGNRAASGALVRRLLGEGLSALELSALPPADGAVICGEIGNVRTARVRVLFALGMNDAGGGVDDGLLTQDEREEAARATGAYLGMSAGERAALSQLDELKALSGARERLVVSYSLADEAGRALREGTAVQALRRLFPAMPVRGGLAEEEQERMLASPRAALEALSVRLSDAADGKADLSPAFRQGYAALLAMEGGPDALSAVGERLASPAPRALRGAKARALYGRPVMSVSRLETLAGCPYRHFVRYGLSPQEPPEPGVDLAELGTLYHKAAERFTRALTERPDFPNVAPEACDALMDEAVRPLIEGWRASPLGASGRGASIARRIERTARRAGRNILGQFSGGGFRPLYSELVFGQNGVAPLTLELPDGSRAYLQGRIDRVDALDGEGRVVRVVDYKSGAKKFDPTMAYYGIQLQLLLYLAAALSLIPDSGAAGFFYCRIADPTVKTPSRVREEVERELAKKLRLSGVSLSDVRILRAQDPQHAAMVTKDGRPSDRHRASLADAGAMDAMLGFARRKAAELARDAFSGVIDDLPAAYGQYSACKTCRYAAVCGFDAGVKDRKRLKKRDIAELR